MKFKVNEIFRSIQGEGAFAGTPAVFVRFSGCNLKCLWCDTEHEQFVVMDENEIAQKICEAKDGQNCRVIFTGGEPTIQENLPALVKFLLASIGGLYSVETNGTNPDVLVSLKMCNVFITVSPKANMINEDIRRSLELAGEVKIVLDDKATPEIYAPYLERLFYKNRAYIQPESEKFAQAVDYVINHPKWTLSVQLQKILKIR